MDIISTYREVGSYRLAADLCGTTHKTVRRTVERFEAEQAGYPPPARAEREHGHLLARLRRLADLRLDQRADADVDFPDLAPAGHLQRSGDAYVAVLTRAEIAALPPAD